MIDSVLEREQQILWFWLISVGRGPLQDLLSLFPLWMHWKTFTSHTFSHWYLQMRRQGFYSANSVCPVPHAPAWGDVICHDFLEIFMQPGTRALERSRCLYFLWLFHSGYFLIKPRLCWLKPTVVLNRTCNNPFKI